ncbi:hypothetical protein [Lysinibacillus sp. NPDC056185]|uniref:hypothetical protein n=1 Tax=Lysinibacillus sp. NPDC056185 TaxID=3345739 RepID=UPI0039EE6CFB
MSAPVEFPDVEALLCVWLRAQLAARGRPVPVATRVPNPRPPAFVTVQRHGGIRATRVSDSPQVGVECWGASDADAHDLAQLVRALLGSLPGQQLDGLPVYRVQEWSGPANLPDPASEQPRYVFELQIHIRGSTA